MSIEIEILRQLFEVEWTSRGKRTESQTTAFKSCDAAEFRSVSANAPRRDRGETAGALGKMVRGKQGLVSLQGPTQRSNRVDDDLTRQFYEQFRSTVYFAVITVLHAAFCLRRPGGDF